MSFPLGVKLLSDSEAMLARRAWCPTYHHKHMGAGGQVGDLWWMNNELQTVKASWKDILLTCRFEALCILHLYM